jgi:DNA repair protein RadC
MSSKDAYHILAPLVMDLSHEEFWVLALNRANKVLGKIFISSGGLAGTIVDTKKLFHKVLDFDRVSALVLCHNHPSGNVNPSESDKELTKKIIAGGKLLDITILDHLIISGNKYLSFADEGILHP